MSLVMFDPEQSAAPYDVPCSPFEELLHSATQGISAIPRLIGMTTLIIPARAVDSISPWKIVGIGIYGTNLILLSTA